MAHRSRSRVVSPLLLALLGLPITLMLVSAYRNQPGAATITVRPAEHYQKIHGWEVVAQASLDYLDDFEHRGDVLSELFDKTVETGITRVRLEARSSIENPRDLAADFSAGRLSAEEWRCARYSTVNDDGDPRTLRSGGFSWTSLDREVRETVLPLKTRLEARGEALWVNLTYVAFTDQICSGYTYAHADSAEYAEFVLAVYEHLRDSFGIVPDSWELMLEPDNTRVWTGQLLADGAAAAAERLKAAGFTPSFIAPATTDAANALRYFEPIWQREDLRPYVTELSYHRYEGASAETIATIGRTARERGIATSMLEHIGSSADALHEDLTVGNVSAWEQFALSWPEPDSGAHLFIIDAGKPPGERAQLSSTGWYLRQYFRAFRPGGIRVGAISDDPAFAPSAVLNVGDRMAVVIKASRGGRITVRGLMPGPYTTSCWTNRARWDRDPDLCAGAVVVDDSGAAIVTMPDPGVFSLARHANVEP